MCIETTLEQGVLVEVEVVRLNPTANGLVVSVLVDGPGPPRLPRVRLTPEEDPVVAARRALSDCCGIRTVHHEPLFVGHHVHPDRQAQAPILTLTFAVLGPVPDSSTNHTRPESFDRIVGSLESNEVIIDHPSVVAPARAAVGVLLETTTIAVLLIPRSPERFRLADLFDVYRLVLGPDIDDDMTNFRRKVESAEGFVERIGPPPGVERRRGRPARWYTAGNATQLKPPIRFGAARPGQGQVAEAVALAAPVRL